MIADSAIAVESVKHQSMVSNDVDTINDHDSDFRLSRRVTIFLSTKKYGSLDAPTLAPLLRRNRLINLHLYLSLSPR